MELSLASLTLPLRLRPRTPISDAELVRFSRENRPLRIERERNGDIVITTPTGNRTGRMNQRLGVLLGVWAEEDGRGITFDSSTGFRLASSSVRSPDASWIAKERWNALTAEEQEGFGVHPDFVIELSSPSDRLRDVKKKIVSEWIANGVHVAWLIDTKDRRVTIFRPDEAPEVLVDPTSVQGTRAGARV